MPNKLYHFVDVHVAHEPGGLFRVARCLAEAGVNVHGLVANRGGVQFLVEDLATTTKALAEDAYHFSVTPMRELKIPDQPGELAGICEMLAWQGANIETAVGIGSGKLARLYIQTEPKTDKVQRTP